MKYNQALDVVRAAASHYCGRRAGIMGLAKTWLCPGGLPGPWPWPARLPAVGCRRPACPPPLPRHLASPVLELTLWEALVPLVATIPALGPPARLAASWHGPVPRAAASLGHSPLDAGCLSALGHYFPGAVGTNQGSPPGPALFCGLLGRCLPQLATAALSYGVARGPTPLLSPSPPRRSSQPLAGFLSPPPPTHL